MAKPRTTPRSRRKPPYEVGYGKPPLHSRFKPGQSGNPKGRPKGTRNLKTDLMEEMNEKITVTEGGQAKVISKQQAMVKAVYARAVKGNATAANLVFGLIARLLEPATGSPDQSAPLDTEDRAILELYRTRSAGASKPAGGEEPDSGGAP